MCIWLASEMCSIEYFCHATEECMEPMFVQIRVAYSEV